MQITRNEISSQLCPSFSFHLSFWLRFCTRKQLRLRFTFAPQKNSISEISLICNINITFRQLIRHTSYAIEAIAIIPQAAMGLSNQPLSVQSWLVCRVLFCAVYVMDWILLVREFHKNRMKRMKDMETKELTRDISDVYRHHSPNSCTTGEYETVPACWLCFWFSICFFSTFWVRLLQFIPFPPLTKKNRNLNLILYRVDRSSLFSNFFKRSWFF